MAQRSTERFLTTHTGSLPRPDDLIRMMYAKEEGVPVDRAALGGARALGGRRGREEAGRRRHRHRQRRRDVEAELRHLRQGPARGLRRHRQHLRLPGSRRLPEAAPSRCSAIPAARGARRRPATRRSACATRRRRATDVDNLKAAIGGVKAQRRLHERGLARRDRAVLPQRPLSERREVSLRHRRGDAARIRGGRQGRLRAADRLPRSRDGPAHPVRATSTSTSSASARSSTSRR